MPGTREHLATDDAQLRPANAGQLVASLLQIRTGVAADAVLRELPQAGDTAPQPLAAPSQTRASAAVEIATAPRQPVQRWLLPTLALAVAGAAAWWALQPAPPPPAQTPASGKQIAPASVSDPVPATSPAASPTSAPPDIEAVAETGVEARPAVADERKPPAAAPSETSETPTEPMPRSEPPTPVRSEPAAAPATTAVADPAPAVRQPPAAPPAATPTQPAAREPVAAQPTADAAPAAAPANPPVLTEVRIDRVSPRVLRAGRSASVRIEGAGLSAVTGVAIASGGATDARFRVGELRHTGDGALAFTLNVARGVPLGSYAVLLQGEGLRHSPILLEVSL